MITAVLGAPGSGKSTVIQPLGACLPAHVILDWDAFMRPAGSLAGREIRQNPDTGPAYRELIRVAIRAVVPVPAVLLSVCTPAELHGWPIDSWVLLDCTDNVRKERLKAQGRPDDIALAIADGHEYRSLGLPVIDTTNKTPPQVATALAEFIQDAER